jgi:hypothetical protein
MEILENLKNRVAVSAPILRETSRSSGKNEPKSGLTALRFLFSWKLRIPHLSRQALQFHFTRAGEFFFEGKCENRFFDRSNSSFWLFLKGEQ